MPNPILQRARTGLPLAGSAVVSTLFALTSAVMLLMHGAFGRYYPCAGFKPPISDLVTALDCSMVTMSTAGYGVSPADRNGLV